MDRPTALTFASIIFGFYGGEYCNKPNTPATHSMIKAYLEGRGVECSHEIIPIEQAADLLIEIGQALKESKPDAE